MKKTKEQLTAICAELTRKANEYIKAKSLVFSKEELPIKAINDFNMYGEDIILFVVDDGKEPNAYNILPRCTIWVSQTFDGAIALRDPGNYSWDIMKSDEDLYYLIRANGFHPKGFRP